MKKLLLLLLFITGIANAQIIPFPDANFKQAIINTPFVQDLMGNFLPSVDMNSDGQIQYSEAANIKVMVIAANANVTDITGVQAFFNMTDFGCGDNQIASIDLTGMTNLVTVVCNNNALTYLNTSGLNQMTSLDFTGNPNLAHLDVSGCTALTYVAPMNNNALTYMDVSNCSSLFSLGSTSNALAYLNVDGCTGLNNISIWNSQLNMFILGGLPNLTTVQFYQNPVLNNLVIINCPVINHLDCSANNLPSINLTGLSNLQYLNCSYNPITSLNVSGMTSMTDLLCGNSLITSLDASSLTNLNYLWFPNNPNLQVVYAKNGMIETVILDNCPNLDFICADDAQVTAVQTSLTNASMTSTVVNSYCSFVPGGNYNTITGTIRLDSNNNGCDASDAAKQNIRVNINEGTNQGATFTNASGVYTFFTQAGNFTITPVVENPTFFTFSPTSAVIPFANTNNNTTTQNFCITANGTHQDLEVVVEPITPARPGFDATYRIVYRNKGNTTVSGSVIFTFNDAKIDYVSATAVPNTIATGSLTWNYTNLLPFETRSVKVALNVNSAIETPAVNIGDILAFGAYINPTGSDDLPLDNSFAYSQTVVGAFDPNNIACIEGTNLPPSEIGKYLHYAINFENTGNFAAQNVVVKDVIDTTKYDITTLQLQNASHPVYTRITGNVVEFIFQNINLAAVGGNPPVGGHGDILFKIKSKSNLVAGNTVSKSAGIYFDYNAPINTNNAQTTFSSLNNAVHEFDNSVKVYPNPAKSIIYISSEYVIESVSVYDIEGRVLETILENSTEVQIDIASKSNGIYFLKINSEKGSKIEKIVKE